MPDDESVPDSALPDEAVPRQTNAAKIGFGVGLTGFLICSAPTFFMCYMCTMMLIEVSTMEIPRVSIRPMGLSCAMVGLPVIAAALWPISFLCAKIAARLGSPTGESLATSGSAAAIAYPFGVGMLSFIIMQVICAHRGITIGS